MYACVCNEKARAFSRTRAHTRTTPTGSLLSAQSIAGAVEDTVERELQAGKVLTCPICAPVQSVRVYNLCVYAICACVQSVRVYNMCACMCVNGWTHPYCVFVHAVRALISNTGMSILRVCACGESHHSQGCISFVTCPPPPTPRVSSCTSPAFSVVFLIFSPPPLTCGPLLEFPFPASDCSSLATAWVERRQPCWECY